MKGARSGLPAIMGTVGAAEKLPENGTPNTRNFSEVSSTRSRRGGIILSGKVIAFGESTRRLAKAEMCLLCGQSPTHTI